MKPGADPAVPWQTDLGKGTNYQTAKLGPPEPRRELIPAFHCTLGPRRYGWAWSAYSTVVGYGGKHQAIKGRAKTLEEAMDKAHAAMWTLAAELVADEGEG